MRLSLIVLPLLALSAVLLAADPETKPAPKPAAKTFSATLINNKDSYTLNAAQSGDAFRNSLKQQGPKPPASAVDLTLRLSNNTDADITISLGGDGSQIAFKLSGDNAVNADNLIPMTMEFRQGTPITLKPGQAHDIKIKSLAGGARSLGQMSYYTEVGDYKLTATLTCASGEKQLTLVTDPITIKVTK